MEAETLIQIKELLREAEESGKACVAAGIMTKDEVIAAYDKLLERLK